MKSMPSGHRLTILHCIHETTICTIPSAKRFMSKLFMEFSKKLFYYFNSWQLTIAFIFLSMQVLMLLGVFASGYAGFPYINYWMLLGYGWFNTVYVWLTLSIIAVSLLIFWVFQLIRQRTNRNITFEAMLMILLALGIATFHVFMQISGGYYQQISSLAYGDRSYHLVHKSSTSSIGFAVIDCDKTSFFCKPIVQIPIESYRYIKRGWDKGTTKLTYNEKTNAVTVKTPSRLITIKQKP
jgi:hypothetical protein